MRAKGALSIDLETSELDSHKESTHDKPWKINNYHASPDLEEISDQDDELINIMAEEEDITDEKTYTARPARNTPVQDPVSD